MNDCTNNFPPPPTPLKPSGKTTRRNFLKFIPSIVTLPFCAGAALNESRDELPPVADINKTTHPWWSGKSQKTAIAGPEFIKELNATWLKAEQNR